MSKTILNTNAIWGQIDQPKTSNGMITIEIQKHYFLVYDDNNVG